MFGWDDALALANTKAGSSFAGEAAKGLFGDDAGTLASGMSTIDSRGILDGSQWTVSTGKGSATGGARTAADAFGRSVTTDAAAPMAASVGPIAGAVLILVALAAWRRFGS